MDIVPVIVEVEDRFGVTIPERHAWPTTVGELYLFLLGQTRRNSGDVCPTSQAFYRLRRTLITDFAIDRRRVRPTTRLCDLFPAASRDAAWPRLAAALGLTDLPELPRRWVPSSRAFGIAFAVLSVVWWIAFPILVLTTDEDFSLTYPFVIWSLLALLVGEFYAIFWFGGLVDHFERVRLPQVRHLVIHMAVQKVQQSGDPTPRRVWEDLAALIANQAGVPVEEIRPERSFGELPDYC